METGERLDELRDELATIAERYCAGVISWAEKASA